MRNFKVDYLSKSGELRLSEIMGKKLDVLVSTEPLYVARLLLFYATQSHLMAVTFGYQFASNQLSLRNSFPRYLDEKFIRGWLEQQLAAKI
jgi:hypothetical protein